MTRVDRPRILHALQQIQRAHGYLDEQELKKFSQESSIPLYRLQEVGSFFPHFAFVKPPSVRLRICRDMSCHLAGSDDLEAQLARHAQNRFSVEGGSCVGRCDRAPAVCVTMAEQAPGAFRGQRYYVRRSADELERIALDCLNGSPPQPDCDADLGYRSSDWIIDPYPGAMSDYAAVKKAVAARADSLARAAELLRAQCGWPRARAEQFRIAAERGRPLELAPDEAMAAAVRAWQTNDSWARGPELGGWADALLHELDDERADLRGMGGAGIPVTQKWRDVRDAVREARRRRADDRAFIVVNGDESEPGTFKDRELLLRAPHLVIEGVILAGLVTEATEGFIYIRHEYAEQVEACEAEIRRVEALGMCGAAAMLGRPFPVSVFVSPGGYICGEQSALIEAMSDRRAEPRNLPPKLETNGLEDQPTLVSNVETFAWVPYVWLNGGARYAELGRTPWRGRRFFSVSGDVNRPGVYEVPMGLTLRELLHDPQYCGGLRDGKPLKAVAPSGPSGGFLPARLVAGSGLPPDHAANLRWQDLARRHGFDPTATELDLLDMELELELFRALSPTQALGAGLVVYAEGRDMADQAVNALQFFRNESCGKCVPCRIGSRKLAALGANLLSGGIDVARWNAQLVPLVRELGEVMTFSSICGLGRAVPAPLRTVIDFFGADVERHLAPEGRR
jgi:NADH:ubiquinone oxidoreductase subunit F (NADH-binding)